MKRSKKRLVRLLLTIVFWVSLLVLVFAFSPSGFFVPLFFLLAFLAVYFLLSLFLPVAFTLSIAILGFLLLRYFHMDNHLNLVLLLALTVSLGLYQSKG
ncbi:MAG: hypothetical protein M1120_00770 [Patescibacteria group bacterium]|nr:hypothetical protein [Patescibacteria group bacterium]